MVHSDSSELTLTILGGSWVALLIWIRLGWSFPGLPTAMANWCICGGLGGQGYPHQPVSHVPPTVLASHRLLGLLLWPWQRQRGPRGPGSELRPLPDSSNTLLLQEEDSGDHHSRLFFVWLGPDDEGWGDDVDREDKDWAKQGKGRNKRGRPLEFYGFLDSFPGGSVGKEPAYNAGDAGTIPGSWRSAGEGIGYPL